MPAKSRKGKTIKLSLHEVQADRVAEDDFDWAKTDFDPSAGTSVALKDVSKRVEYSRVANNALNEKPNFRDLDNLGQSNNLPENLEPPYVAHFGNLTNGIKEEEFRGLFLPDVLNDLRLISREGRTYAFVEFNSAHALSMALNLKDYLFKKRKLRVDLATKEQIERMVRRNRPTLSRDDAGQMPGSVGSGLGDLDISRDAFGAPQPECGSFYSKGSGINLQDMLSRDMIGSAKQVASPTFRGQEAPVIGGAEQPASPFSSLPESRGEISLDNWRDTPVVEQPAMPQSPKDGSRWGRKRESSAVQSPSSERGSKFAAVGNWREESATSPSSEKEKSNRFGRPSRREDSKKEDGKEMEKDSKDEKKAPAATQGPRVIQSSTYTAKSTGPAWTKPGGFMDRVNTEEKPESAASAESWRRN